MAAEMVCPGEGCFKPGMPASSIRKTSPTLSLGNAEARASNVNAWFLSNQLASACQSLGRACLSPLKNVPRAGPAAGIQPNWRSS